jgi:hypothetical protein
MAGAPIPELLFVEALGMRGCQSPGAGRCITAPGKVSGSRRFYVIIRGTDWSGGAVATETANGPFRDVIDWQILLRAPYKLSRGKGPVWLESGHSHRFSAPAKRLFASAGTSVRKSWSCPSSEVTVKLRADSGWGNK